MSEAHGNPNELAPNGVGTDDQPNGRGGKDWADFLSRFDTSLGKLGENIGAKLDAVRSTVTDATKPPPPEAPNFDEMTNSQIVQYLSTGMQGAIKQMLEQALAPITEQLGRVSTETATVRGSLDMRDMVAKYKDFKDWPEMVDLAKRHPTLGWEEVYQLARGLNPKKAGELELKYNPPPPKPKPWGGFGGLTASAGGKPEEPVLKGEAAGRAAYAEVAARHPGILPQLQEMFS